MKNKMIHLQAKDLDHLQNYKLISGSIIPRAISWISTLNENKKVNLAPFSFFTGVAKKYPLVSVSILRKENSMMKDTAKNLLSQKEGVINLVNIELLERMNNTAASLEYGVSEADINDIEMIKSSTVSVSGVADALARFEVKLYEHHAIEVNGEVVSDLFILEVIDFHYDSEVIDTSNYHIDYDKLSPAGRLSGPNYTEIGKKYSFVRPK